MQAVTAGQPAAFSAVLTDFEKLPEAKIIAANKDALMQAGFGLYRSLDGNMGVVFNQLFIAPEELTAADQAGQLQTIAPPFAELNAAVASSGAENPVLAEGERPTGFKTGGAAPAPAAPEVSSGSPLPASTQTALANKRSANLRPGAPTSGAVPGAGRLLNSVLRPII